MLSPAESDALRSEEEKAYLKCCCEDLRDQLWAALKREEALKKELAELKK